MKTISINSTLAQLGSLPDVAGIEGQISFSFVNKISYTSKLDPKSLITKKSLGSIYHVNYVEYLEFCWARHYSPVISPDIIWFGLLNEIASLVRENQDVCRSLFSTTEAKQEIIVPTFDPVVLPLDLIIDQLTQLVPSGVDAYISEFSTTTQSSRLAQWAAFCDVVSPYYSYMMYLCGFPAIKVDGSVDDYAKIASMWENLPDTLKKIDQKFFDQVQSVLNELRTAVESIDTAGSINWFKKIFKATRCGSGHQTQIDGWITKLQRKQPDGPRYAGNFSTQVATVKYKELTTGRKFTMLYGLFSSKIIDDMAAPEFSPLIFDGYPNSRDA